MTTTSPSPGLVSGLQCRLPLIIGVTGHRDLRGEDIGALEGEVREAFSRIRRDYLGAAGDTPLIVMSSLAEGADQLVARVALEAGAGLVCPLPMPADEYRRDFAAGSPEAAEFERLLSQAIAAPEMPFVAGGSLESIRVDASRRALQYREAGLFIVRRCHILLALWDGDAHDAKTGGTAEIVSLRQSGFGLNSGTAIRDCIDGAGAGPVILIRTPRRKAPDRRVDIRTLPWGRELLATGPQEEAQTHVWKDFGGYIGLTVDYNRDARRLLSSAAGAAMFRQGLMQLIEAPETQVVSAQAGALVLHAAPLLCATFAIADRLAQYNQQRVKNAWRSLFVLAFLMAVALGVPSVEPGVKAPALVVYELLFFCSFGLYLFARRRQYQAKYLDYRALSEAARVGIFWKIAGIRQTVADAYPVCQTLELSWVRLSLKSLECFKGQDIQFDAALDAMRYSVCRDIWVRGQLAYFRKRGARHAQVAGRSKFVAVSFVSVAGVGAFLIGAAQFFSVDWKNYAPFHVGAYIPLLLELMPAAAAAIQGYAEALGRTAQAMQFDRMRALFERALTILPASFDESEKDRRQEVFQELGRESIQEAASWTSIFRLRPLKPV